jgi:hypothetical protein
VPAENNKINRVTRAQIEKIEEKEGSAQTGKARQAVLAVA